MDKIDFQKFVEGRIQELEELKAGHVEKMEIHKLASDNLDVKIGELKTLVKELDSWYKQLCNESVAKEIKKNTLKGLLVDSKDGIRFNIFIEFLDLCGDEAVYRKALAKMRKLSSAIYGKNRLWLGWREFREDFHLWIDRKGKWEGILDK